MRESKHFTDMLVERGIKKEWAMLALDSPDRIEKKGDGTRSVTENTTSALATTRTAIIHANYRQIALLLFSN